MSFRRSSAAMVALVLLMAGLQARVTAFPVDGDQTALPAKTELNEDAIDKPREVFRSELCGAKILPGQSRQPGIQLAVDLRRRGAAGRNELRHLPCQRRRQRQILHAEDVDAPGQFRHDRTAVQSESGQRPARSGQDSEPARRTLSGALWRRRPHAVAARLRSQRDRQRVCRAGAVAGHSRCDRRLHPGYRLPAQSKPWSRPDGWSGRSANRSDAAKRCSRNRSRTIPA